jgi:hypothetical protein
MPDYLMQIKKLVARYEAQARKEVGAQLPRRRSQLLAALRSVRKLMNAQLTALERRIRAAGPRKRRR